MEWLLFLTLWLTYGLVINSENLGAFGLQQAGVEAYVERHHFYLEGSQVPPLQVRPVVDAFLHDGHIYPAKQPGQFMAGACAYFVLHAFGLSYAGNYLLTAALVTFLTASLATAASAVAVFRIARGFAAESFFWPLLTALAYGLGTTIFAYSGIAWHDTLATSYLTIALYLVIRVTRVPGTRRKSSVLAAGAGALLGLTVTTSMLAFFPATVVAICFIGSRRWNLFPAFLVGGLMGLAPLFIYNAVCFGNPFQLSNIVGHYTDTFFQPAWDNFWSKLGFYARMLALYAPIVWLGLLGLALYPRSLWREKLVLAGMMLALAGYVLNIEATGTCQYGPRYLLPIMPLAALGLMGFSFLRGKVIKATAALTAGACFLVSFIINLIGAMHGAMLCDFPGSAVPRYLSEMLHGGMRSYPLAETLIAPFFVCLFLFASTLVKSRTPRAV